MSIYRPFRPVNAQNFYNVARLGAAGLGTTLVREAALYRPAPSKKSLSTNKRVRTFTSTKTKMRQPRKSVRKVATVAAVKRMIGQVVEKKQNSFGVNQAFGIGNNNTVHSANLTAKIIQGTTDGSRIGDSIFINSVHMNMSIATATDSSYYRYRVIIGWSGEEYNISGVNVTGLGGTEVFILGNFRYLYKADLKTLLPLSTRKHLLFYMIILLI